jgi:Uma2 family endonuclease
VSEPARLPMTSDAFIAWAMEQPETKHYELFDGEILAMAPERSAHALTKFHISRRLADLVEAAELPCVVYPDGMAVEIDDRRGSPVTFDKCARRRCQAGRILPTAIATALPDRPAREPYHRPSRTW